MTSAESIELSKTSRGLKLILRNTNRITKVGESIEFKGKVYLVTYISYKNDIWILDVEEKDG